MAHDSQASSDELSASDESLVQYQRFWCYKSFVQGVEAMRCEFKARPDDIILASSLKTGTTWIKALVYAILTSKQYDLNDPSYPLNRTSPHELIPNIEMQLYGPYIDSSRRPFNSMSPRVFHTHVPYQALPDSIKSSGCKIIYIARNPKDTFVSLWQMIVDKMNMKDPFTSKEEALRRFCRGFIHTGPFIEHVASYWRERNKPNVLCLTFEDLKADTVGCIRVLSDFLGCWWVKEEQDMKNIADKCSFESLSEMEVNKNGELDLRGLRLRNDSFFREGKVGGWRKLFTAEMNAEMDKMIEENISVLANIGLQFKYELGDANVEVDERSRQLRSD